MISSYDSNRDLIWLSLKPWILLPRLFQILSSLFILTFRMMVYGSSKDEEVHKRLAKTLLKTLTNLGPCFIKVGQALSTRPDLIRKDWLEELTNLQDNLPPFEHIQALKVIQDELGAPAEELFTYFPEIPIASASLGQVYKAKLNDNYWVAVKIQRPNLVFILRRDLVIVKMLSVITSPLLPLNLGFKIGDIIDEFGRTLFEEIDYEMEADNAERFAHLFSSNPAVIVPKVERRFSSRKVITTSWIEGTKLKNSSELIESSLDPSTLIKTGVVSGLQQLLEFGYFHADPHPGNMFALQGQTEGLGHLAYIDFGMMDEISNTDRMTLISTIVHLINKDFTLLGEDFQKLGFLNSEQDLKPIIPVLEEVLGGSLGAEVINFNFKEITDRFSELMFNYPFRVPARFALIIRAVVSQEGLALRLNPEFKIIGVAYPYVAKRILSGDTNEMLELLLELIFDQSGRLRLDRLENLFEVLIEDTEESNKNLLQVAISGFNLVFSEKGHLLRKNLLMTLVKEEKLDTSDLKNLLKLIHRKFKIGRLTKALFRQLAHS